MAKKASKKKSKAKTSDRGTRKVDSAKDQAKLAAQRSSNPYEIFQNRPARRKVLGERIKGEKRNALKSRARADFQRKEGLVRESFTDSRTSRFKDARPNEMPGGDGVTGERTSVKRLVKLRQKQTRKSFNLDNNSKEELLVGGRPLSSLNDAELRGDVGDGSDEDPDAHLAALTAGSADDVITRSKMWKAEAVIERENQENQLKDLDADFGSLMNDLQFRPTKGAALKLDSGMKKEEPDGYDKLVRQLAFEHKAVATERTKTPEELAQERSDKLEELERNRVARLEADTTTVVAADADAAGNTGSALFSGEKPKTGTPRSKEDVDDEDQDDDDEQSEEAGEEEEEEEEAEKEDDKEDDAGSSSDAEEGEVGDRDEDDERGEGCARFIQTIEAEAVDIMINEKSEDGLAFAVECPNNVRSMEALLKDRSPRTCLKVIQRIRAREGKSKGFLTVVLDYVLHSMGRSDGDLSSRGIEIAYALRTVLLEMANDHPDITFAYFRERLQGMGPSTLPRAKELACLKLIAMLFPVTDFQHPITTPAALITEHWASKIAAIGADINDLVSEAMFLWEILYEFTIPACRYCASFFQLGTALLDTCLVSAKAGRTHCVDAAKVVSTLFVKALKSFSEAESVVAHLAAKELLRPAVERIVASSAFAAPLQTAIAALNEEMSTFCGVKANELRPLALFTAEPAQIRGLDPIFHEIGDSAGMRRGMEMSETKQLKRKLNKERRAATRQLSRDASALQQLQGRKEAKVAVGRKVERKRVNLIMEEEKVMLKKLGTEVAGTMDTSLGSYSSTKERKKANPRMGGNKVAEVKKKP